MTVKDRNLTGTTPAGSRRFQKTRKPNRNSRLRFGTAASGEAGDCVSRAIAAFEFERANRLQARAVQYQSGGYHPDSAATARGIVSEALLAEG
jgi:hypothetical protein